MGLYRKANCRYCSFSLPEPFLDLGITALANSFLTPEEAAKEAFSCPLRLTRCSHCGLVQLLDVVPPEKMFSHYLYVSSTTQIFQKHFSDYARAARSRVLKKKAPWVAVDIGSNDGLLVSCYESEGMKGVGVEPASNLAQEANRQGRVTLNDYFGARSVAKILKDYGPADVVSANNVFAHIDDIHTVLKNLAQLLHAQGVFIMEFPYLPVMVEQMLFDLIYHEHLSYISLAPLKTLMESSGFNIFDVEEVASHGGSLRVFVEKKGGGHPLSGHVEALLTRESEKDYNDSRVYQDFAKRVYSVRDELVRFVKTALLQGKTLSGYGAPAKGNTLINFCRFTPREVQFLVDDNPLKQNRLSPGAHIPVVNKAHLLEHPTDYVLILAWNFAEEIIPKLESLRKKGVQFVIPLPHPKVV